MIKQTLEVTNRLKILPILVALTLIVWLNGVALAAPPLQTGDQRGDPHQNVNQDNDEDNDNDGAAQNNVQAQTQLQQPAQQAGAQQQGTMANQNLLSAPEGMSKIIFENLSTRDLIVDVSSGPSPQSVWVNPGTQQQFVIQPGQYVI